MLVSVDYSHLASEMRNHAHHLLFVICNVNLASNVPSPKPSFLFPHSNSYSSFSFKMNTQDNKHVLFVILRLIQFVPKKQTFWSTIRTVKRSSDNFQVLRVFITFSLCLSQLWLVVLLLFCIKFASMIFQLDLRTVLTNFVSHFIN